MILRITAEDYEVDAAFDKYLRGKLDRLNRLVPRGERATALAEIRLSERQHPKGQVAFRTCGLGIKLRRVELQTRETTRHMYASLDVAAADLEQQLRDYRRQRPRGLRRYAGRRPGTPNPPS